MKCVLVLETTLGGLGLALQRADGQVFGRSTTEPRSSSQLHPLLADLLAEAQIATQMIETLGVTVGPGSFTGARVAVAVAEAWGLAQPQCQRVGLATLPLLAKAVLARGEPPQGFRILTDAAGGMAYGQDFAGNGTALGEAWCLPLAEAVNSTVPIFVSGLPLLEGVTHLGAPTPQDLLATLADLACHLPLIPVYLKPLAYRERPER
ncbi:MAG: tRNA (adenosine(37)-N6)-threonylcarbamoyltransferase complex dimerization subunit type 1 TsaB [Alphaproteobacteria bacterium]|jgi:tRNA threonylcarbamoyladenosine biosynthesis protein TsaB|nr:tRNA (adenosine(37)-N6)-threonylcarbamoyltransferase complex dimerization subunit type 1 TsaB [Alphaproteobacteria bacterium]